MKDALGDRMKDQYENRTRYLLPRRTYTIIRIDGKAFHTYTKGLKRPFDSNLIEDMNETCRLLCKNMQGAKFGYVQSDEISILLTDFETQTTNALFDGSLQKMVSISASMATAYFNELREPRVEHARLALFDSRVFTVPDIFEVANYFIWRQKDATRNSITAVAQSLYSHKELDGKSSNEKQEMIFKKGTNWNDYSVREKRGGFITKVPQYIPTPIPGSKEATELVLRHNWEITDPPIFTQEPNFLLDRIPKIEGLVLENDLEEEEINSEK